MSREDLLSLTPEALAVLANMGLVKRAQREIGEGLGPRLEEDGAGTVTGVFPDGTIASLPRATSLDDAPCTCGAPRACRHRVAIALAYAPWHSSQSAPEAGSSPRTDPWCPGDIDDRILEQVFGNRLLASARSTLDRGLVVEVERGPAPTARLPSCTVKFLVPRDAAYARCDCVDGGGRCEHIALAVWAFRALQEGAANGVVSLGGDHVRAELPGAALVEARALAHLILESGVTSSTGRAALFARARVALENEGLVWILGIVTELEMALEGYARRSARHGTREIAALLFELGVRLQAGSCEGGELPARFILGGNEAPQTKLDHVRLVSLGARLEQDGRSRCAEVFLADPDTRTVLVLRKQWDYRDGESPEDGPDLARRHVGSRMRLGDLAHGVLVSKAITRRANRSLVIGTAVAGGSSIVLSRGDFGSLPPPLFVGSLKEHQELVRSSPPRFLQPRHLASEVHAVAVGSLHGMVYSEAEQSLHAQLEDTGGTPFSLSIAHRRVAPHAVTATAAALQNGVSFITGRLERISGRWHITPLALGGSSMVVPDLAGPIEAPFIPRGAPPGSSDPIHDALDRAEVILQDFCHSGLRAVTAGALERARAAAAVLESVGLQRLAGRLLRAHDGPGSWLDTAARLHLTREACGRSP